MKFLSAQNRCPSANLALKLPICNFDAKTGILCANCESRLKAGEITKADVEASTAVARLVDKTPGLSKATLKRAWETRGSYVLEFEQADLPALRSSPELTTRLEETLGGKAWVVGAGSDERRFLEDLLFPARVLTVNTVWLPDGRKRTKVIVPRRRNERRFGDFDKLRDAVKEARGIELLIETEGEAALRPWS